MVHVGRAIEMSPLKYQRTLSSQGTKHIVNKCQDLLTLVGRKIPLQPSSNACTHQHCCLPSPFKSDHADNPMHSCIPFHSVQFIDVFM